MPRPQLNAPIGNVGNAGGPVVVMSRQLYDLLVSLSPNPNQEVITAAVGASPWTYTNASGFRQDVLVNGGTVSAIEFGRAGVFYPAASPIHLGPGDSLRLTYTVLPTVTVIPR